MTVTLLPSMTFAFGQRPPNKEDAKTAAEKLGLPAALCAARSRSLQQDFKNSEERLRTVLSP
jgi:hypothetical protein